MAKHEWSNKDEKEILSMDHEVTYTFAIDLPINQETTKLYSMNKEMKLMALQHALNQVKGILKKEEFISLERILRIFGFRANYETPHILFTELQDSNFGNDLLTLFLSNGFELDTIFGSKIQKPQLQIATNEESGDEEWPGEQKQTETSESEEKEKT